MRFIAIIIAIGVTGCASPKSNLETTKALNTDIPSGSTVALHFDAPEAEPAEDAPIDQREAYVLATHLKEPLSTFLTYEGHFESVVASDEPADFDMRVDVIDAHLELYGDNKTSNVYGDVAEFEITLEDRTDREVISVFRVDAAAKKKFSYFAFVTGKADLVLQPNELVDLSVERILEGLDS